MLFSNMSHLKRGMAMLPEFFHYTLFCHGFFPQKLENFRRNHLSESLKTRGGLVFKLPFRLFLSPPPHLEATE